MYDEFWSKPLILVLPRPRGQQTITSVREAAECLMEMWPEHHRHHEHDEALRLCLEVIENGGHPDSVRSALIAAAQSARIKVPETGS